MVTPTSSSFCVSAFKALFKAVRKEASGCSEGLVALRPTTIGQGVNLASNSSTLFDTELIYITPPKYSQAASACVLTTAKNSSTDTFSFLPPIVSGLTPKM